MGYEEVLDKLEEQGLLGREAYDGNQAFRCPAHDDTRASGSLQESSEGHALLYCHAGCETEDIVEELGLEMKDLFMEEKKSVEATYEYRDEDGALLYRVVRFRPKGFTQERWEEDHFTPGLGSVKRVLYNLPELREASRVYIVEGEKDVERLRTEGVTATCNVGGANVWRPEWSASLRGKDVIIIPDGDAPGEKHARAIQAALDGVANRVEVKYAASGKDVSNHLDAGYSLSQLRDESNAEDEFAPLDWETYEAPETEWLYHPYIPTRGRVLVFGKAGSLKSLWVMWIATRLSRQGRNVAYFSLEMRPEQTVARLKKLRPPRENFKVFTNYKMGDADYRRRTIEALRGFDLIVVDSWNAAYRFTGKGSHDDQVAALDDEFFQPIIEGTGATLVVIDNTGHDMVVGFGNKIQSQHARGSSAKGDKMDVTIFLTRPDEGNNYLTEVHVKKMRYDIPIPSKRLVVAPSEHDGIEFFNADGLGQAVESAWNVEDDVINDVPNETATEGSRTEVSVRQQRDDRSMVKSMDQVVGLGVGGLDVPNDERTNEPRGEGVQQQGLDHGRMDGSLGKDSTPGAEATSVGKVEELNVPDDRDAGKEKDRLGVGGLRNSRERHRVVEVLERASEAESGVRGGLNVPDRGTDSGMETNAHGRTVGGLVSNDGSVLQADGARPVMDESLNDFEGWSAKDKLAFIKAQRLFEEILVPNESEDEPKRGDSGMESQ